MNEVTKQGQGQRNMHAPHQPTAVWLLEAKTRALETSSRHSKRADRSFKRPLRRTAVFFFPKKTRQLDLHSDFFDPLGRSVEQRNASPHHEQPCSFTRKVHSHTCIGRSQRFVVFVGDSGSFFPQITHERFKRKLTRTPGPDGSPRHAPHRDASAFTATSR